MEPARCPACPAYVPIRAGDDLPAWLALEGHVAERHNGTLDFEKARLAAQVKARAN